jgi:hypothetical protein
MRLVYLVQITNLVHLSKSHHPNVFDVEERGGARKEQLQNEVPLLFVRLKNTHSQI